MPYSCVMKGNDVRRTEGLAAQGPTLIAFGGIAIDAPAAAL
jgi:hypothetical protein